MKIFLGPAGLGSPAIKGVEFVHNKKLIEVIGGGERRRGFRGGRNPYIYSPTNDGIEFIRKNGGKFP